jgi:O-antigen/teichoic acid export membrane protein
LHNNNNCKLYERLPYNDGGLTYLSPTAITEWNTLPTAKQKFGRDVLLSGIATCVRSLRIFLFLPVLTHSLDEVQLGLWEQVMVGIGLAIPWVSLQLPGALVRFLPGVKDPKQQREITYSLFFLAITCSIALALIFGFCFYLLLADTRWEPLRPMFPAVLALIVMSTCLESIRAYFRALRYMVHHSSISIAQYFGELMLVAYTLLKTNSLADGLLSLLVIRSALSIIGAFSITRQLGFSWPHFTNTRAYLKFSIPLIPNSALYRLFDAGDRYLLAHFLNHAAVGVYFVSYTAASFFTTIVSPVHLVLLPALAELWNNGDKEKIGEYITDIIRYTTILSLPFIALAILVPTEILAIFTSGAYVESARYIPILALGFFAFSLGVPGDHILVAAGKTHVLFITNSAMVLANLVMNLILIPRIGIAGAALSTLAGHTIYALTMLILAKRIAPFAIPWRHLLIATLNTAALAIALVVAMPYFPLVISIAACGIIYVLLCFFTGVLDKREWNFMCQLIYKK